MNQHTDGTVVATQPAGTNPSPGSFRPQGVLIVDDDAALRAVVGAMARVGGFAVWLAADCTEAVVLLREHRAAIDVLLLDVHMPICDGQGTLAALRTLAPNVPCCFMSADTEPRSEAYLLGLGAAVVLRKPFRFNELVSRLRQFATPPGSCGTPEGGLAEA